jgi:hypothetical protein
MVNLNKNTHPYWGESLTHTVPPRLNVLVNLRERKGLYYFGRDISLCSE